MITLVSGPMNWREVRPQRSEGLRRQLAALGVEILGGQSQSQSQRPLSDPFQARGNGRAGVGDR